MRLLHRTTRGVALISDVFRLPERLSPGWEQTLDGLEELREEPRPPPSKHAASREAAHSIWWSGSTA